MEITDEVAASIFAKSLGCMLRDQEGIFVNTRHGEFIVCRQKEMLYIVSDEEEIADAKRNGAEDGGLVWMHDSPEDVELAKALEEQGIHATPDMVRGSKVTH